MSFELKPVATQIKELLENAFSILYLEIENESDKHSGPANRETHFRILVVSDSFTGMTRVQRAQAINKLLASLYANGLHALSQQSYTSLEWQKFASKLNLDSPPCAGGSTEKINKKD